MQRRPGTRFAVAPAGGGIVRLLGREALTLLQQEAHASNIANPAAPQTVEETGVRRTLLEELALKTLFTHGEMSLCELADHMRLELSVIEELFLRLRKEQQCEVKGMRGVVHCITVTGAGRARALELLSLNQYVGPAPVSLPDYVRYTRSQSIRQAEVHSSDVEKAFEHLVLSERTIKQLGTAAISGTSIFLYGPPGTGKTSIAEALPAIYNDSVWLPHAVEVDGQLIVIYDSAIHQMGDVPAPSEHDQRWVLCRRPRVVTGGELTIEMLDLQFNPHTKFYTAPLQLKANGGVLIIDDFGRQRVHPEELLNRWIVPLDRRTDYLTLAGGKKFEVPFEVFVVFATNLEPSRLAEEAFLRRIPNKIRLDSVSTLQFQEILRLVCQSHQVHYESDAIKELVHLLTVELKQPLRPCYARDLVQQICWSARYDGKPPKLNSMMMARACANYFLSHTQA